MSRDWVKQAADEIVLEGYSARHPSERKAAIEVIIERNCPFEPAVDAKVYERSASVDYNDNDTSTVSLAFRIDNSELNLMIHRLTLLGLIKQGPWPPTPSRGNAGKLDMRTSKDIHYHFVNDGDMMKESLDKLNASTVDLAAAASDLKTVVQRLITLEFITSQQKG